MDPVMDLKHRQTTNNTVDILNPSEENPYKNQAISHGKGGGKR
jgi:hypothetical protein